MNTDKFIISGGQCHGLELAGQACGATPEFTEWLRTKENFFRIVDVWRGHAEITLRVVSFLTATSKQVVNYDRSIADSLKAGKYGWKNDDITDANFPSTETGEREVEFGMFYFNKNTESDANIAQMKS
ncbi:MAG: hypothetical protein NTU76_04140, partial [Candidatus Taylorbacteria bacterium]|nr:hypothetical protein [Candidatus Taylorbacteria bacterium]